jgi:transcriptional regulator GlxA family with amidase domain
MSYIHLFRTYAGRAVHQIGFVIYPGFQIMSLSTITAFEVANLAAGETIYEVTMLSETGGLVRASAGFGVETASFDNDKAYDTVLIGASTEIQPASLGLIAFVKRAMGSSRRVAAPCTGAFVLAEAGALDNRRATTHWLYSRDLQKRFPELKVDQDRIFIVDGPVWTSAGMTAAVDLALAMVERDLGAAIAQDVARKLVVYHRRAGGQSQFSVLLGLDAKSDRIQTALDYARRNLRNALSVDELAEAAHLSPRQFSRAFHNETGQSPAKAVESLRVEAARVMIEQGRHSLDVIATETGFDDRERMRRAFLRTLGQPPQAIRRGARVMT